MAQMWQIHEAIETNERHFSQTDNVKVSWRRLRLLKSWIVSLIHWNNMTILKYDIMETFSEICKRGTTHDNRISQAR